MPTQRGARTRIAPGVFSDAIGLSAVVKIGSGKTGTQKEKRFARGTSLKEIRDWQSATRAALAKKRGRSVKGQTRGTLAADVQTYLATILNRPKYGSAKSCLAAWCEAFGHRRRSSLTLAELQAQMDRWEGSDTEPGRFAGSTLMHCKDHLVDLYRVLDVVDDADNLATKLRRPAQADPEPRAIPDAIVEEIFDAMPLSRARACLKVMAYVGLPPARLRRLKPTQLDLQAKTVFLVRRRKGKGTDEKTFGLTDRGVLAFQEFIQINAWGGVTKESLLTCFQRGVNAANRLRAKANLPLIPPVRPYDLRHTFGAATYRATGDIGAAAELLDVTLETAKRYTLSAVPDQLKKAVEALNQAYPVPEAPKKPVLQIVRAKRG